MTSMEMINDFGTESKRNDGPVLYVHNTADSEQCMSVLVVG